MASHTKVTDETGSRMKLSRAKRLIELCAYAWVVEGISIRRLSLKDSIAARAKQARDREPLPFAEIHGLAYSPPAGSEGAYRESRRLAYEAAQFVNTATA